MKRNLILRVSCVLLVCLVFIVISPKVTINIWDEIDSREGDLRDVLKNDTKDLQRKIIELDGRGGKVNLSFDYVIDEGNLTVFPHLSDLPGTAYEVTEMPNSNEVIVEHEGILYVANILDEEIKPLLKDQMDDYSLKDAIEQSLQLRDDGSDPFVWWGSRASVNPSGTIMAFFTNRSGESEIWMKNLTNGEEEKLLNSHMKVKKWINDDEFIASESHDVFRFNVLTRKKDYFGKSSTFDVSDRYVVLQEKDGLLDFHNLDNNEHKQYESSGFNYVRAIATLENSAWIAVLNQLKRESIYAELYLINTEDFTTKVLEIPDPFIALVIEWKSKDELYLVVEDRVTQIQETKIINTNDL